MFLFTGPSNIIVESITFLSRKNLESSVDPVLFLERKIHASGSIHGRKKTVYENLAATIHDAIQREFRQFYYDNTFTRTRVTIFFHSLFRRTAADNRISG